MTHEPNYAADRAAAADWAQLTKTRKRIANGVCPCCHRTFQNLARHMAGQHPAYEESDQEAKGIGG